MIQQPFIVGFGGAIRSGSSTERLVGRVLAQAEALGARTQQFDGAALAALPHYDPGNPLRTTLQTQFLDAIRRADAVVIGSPVYHGGIAGVVKNAIDLIGDLAKDDRVFLDGRPVGLVVSAGGEQGAGVTLSAMRDIVHALRGWPTPVGVAVNANGQPIFTEDGAIASASLAKAVATQAAQLLAFAGQPVRDLSVARTA
ncbi:MAG: NADPH-dependent FMN reductase [Asticcacaulis sp.]